MKAVLICVNILAIAVGLGMIGFGAWMLHSGTSLFEMLNALDQRLGSGISMERLARVAERKSLLRFMAIATTASGCVAVATGVLGIVAVVQRSALLAIAYKVTVFLMLACHITGTAFILFKKAFLQDEIESVMLQHQRMYFVARTSQFSGTDKLHQAVTNFFEHMHITYQCCGVMTPTDIRNSSSFRKSIAMDPKFKALMPASCCKAANKDQALTGKARLKLVDPDCPYSLNSTALHKEACFHPVRRLADKVILPVLIACGLFAVVLATALGTMAAQMCSGFDEDDDYDYDSDSDYDSEEDSD